MLSRPKIGWTTITIEDFTAEGSYLADIPFDWLRACLNGLQYDLPVALFIEEEGSTCTIVTEWIYTYIIIHRDDSPEMRTLPIDRLDIISELVDDFEAYFEDWVTEFDEKESDDKTARRTELRELLDSVKTVLDEKKKACHGIGVPRKYETET